MKHKEVQKQIEILKLAEPRSPAEAISIQFEINRLENLEEERV